MKPGEPHLNPFQSLGIVGDECGRLDAVRGSGLWHTPPEAAFDRIVELARTLCQTPVALFSLLDRDRQWFKARSGTVHDGSSRSDSICTLVVEQVGPLVIPDTHLDPRVAARATVTGPMNVRAYAGVPVVTPDGYALGTLCVIDHRPRPFTPEQIEALTQLAEVLGGELERRAVQVQLERLSLTDALTGLPNRAEFREHLRQATQRVTLSGERVALALLDLDGFKVINDSLGHQAGDELLQQVATRLREELSSSDLVARMGGDEFALVLTDVRGIGSVERVLTRLRDAMQRPFTVAGRDLPASFSAGVSLYPDDGVDAEEMLARADTAMYRAKRAGLGWAFFNALHDSRSASDLELLSALHHAGERGELLAYFQPVVRANDYSPAGCEALVRWQRGGQLISPADFIPLAERSGQIHQLGEFMLRAAAREIHRGRLRRVAVNVSPLEFDQPGYVQRVAAILNESGIDPDRLVLEITESSLLDADRSRAVLRDLRALGVQLALDDFGTGYSSLSALSSLPVQHLKIDRSFVRDVGQDGEVGVRALEVVRAIVTLARALNLNTVAEGVETPGQAALLRDVGCTYLQGFHFGRPAPLA
ncbi:EAL domain-containing protein [Deinococcus xianganensis]|uniref:EAL domain-containing protein n=1 Tax=Deinococcus xianganensis TaxID=1507289 RepID=A0A6I4YAJ6_9DEIO|nr:EAL domain-containing protein [Deinococcus xianganensis]MXV18392.1 EAL domain-containing protein [Deinococcus xianganensis]